MENCLYRVTVSAVTAEVGPEGVTTTEIPCTSYAVEALPPQDAVIAAGDQLAAEEAS
jgi:hypothetical protein